MAIPKNTIKRIKTIGSFLNQRYSRIFLLLILMLLAVECLDYDNALCNCEESSHFNESFVFLWNSPAEGCRVNFSVNIDLEMYGILTNQNQTWDGNRITVFYNRQLGLYPTIEDQNRTYNGGLPQLVNMSDHLKKVVKDIDEKIPDRNFNGIAMIDWEMWRPLWETNFQQKYIYRLKSIEEVKKEYNLKNKSRDNLKNSTLENGREEMKQDEDEIEKEAKERFETGARNLMEQTILLGRKIRPYALWGFYDFPACFGDVRKKFICERENDDWNGRLLWLYNSSTVLLPSIYLHRENMKNKQYVKEKLTIAFRFINNNGTRLPVFPYLRPLYVDTASEFKMLTEDDLENTIGQSADMGCAGLVFWGSHLYERKSKKICEQYNKYVHDKLGPYITLVREELETCSREQCHSNGRCVEGRKNNLKLRKGTCDKGKTIFNLTKKDDPGTNKSVLTTKEGKISNILQHHDERNRKNINLTNQTKNIAISLNNSSDVSTKKMKVITSKIAIFNETRLKSVRLKKNPNISTSSVAAKMKNEPLLNDTKSVDKNTKKQGYGTPSSSSATAAATEETTVRIPSVYIILITVTLGGALLMTVIYVAIYYAVNVRGKHEHSYENNFEEDNPFSLDDHDEIWWNEKLDQKEKLLKKNKK